jgi:SAM-dependent methyltransferase
MLKASTLQPLSRLSEAVQQRLRCPVCGAALEQAGDHLQCLNPDDGTRFPIVDGIPVLINEANSLFSIDDFRQQRKTTMSLDGDSSLKARLKDALPTLTRNTKSGKNYEQFAQHLLALSPNPTVLVVGGSIVGQGMDVLLRYPSIEWVETDVSFGPRTGLICDGHDVPFEDGSFDGVIVQAVLEHVVDPYRCVAEIHRVLKPQGIVYAETPFMQQVHMGRYDFTRFTHLGHRRLFRHFEELDTGAVVGPASALAWSYQYFLLSWTSWKPLRRVLKAVGRLTSFYIPYLDDLLINRPSALDAASAYYFLGRRSDHVLSDRDLIKQYKGSM